LYAGSIFSLATTNKLYYTIEKLLIEPLALDLLMALKNLSIGVQSSKTIIEKDFLYIDKTRTIQEVIKPGRTYFLSRPRRFGKSLLVSTLEAKYLGKKELFKNTWTYTSDFA
jgi:hypothetical protein